MDNKCNLNFQALQDTLDVINSKWRVQILCSICECGNHRFRDIERSIPKLTTRMLSRELKIMESMGLIIRSVYPTTPVTVEYKETDLCHTLIPIFDAMLEWGEKHGKSISTKYDANMKVLLVNRSPNKKMQGNGN